MGHRVHRKSNDGNFTGLKQDKFRNSDFEFSGNEDRRRFEGVSQANLNTLGGKWSGSRQGWDAYYETRDKESRSHGGSLSHNDFGDLKGNTGKGPRGYIRQDSRIHDDVCELLTRDNSIDASQVDVSVERGVVTLMGKVDDRDMKRYAGNIIDRLPGVRDVQNLLEFERR